MNKKRVCLTLYQDPPGEGVQETWWSRRAMQADTDGKTDRRAASWNKCVYTGKSNILHFQNASLLLSSLYACIDVATVAFPPSGLPVVCIVLLWNDKEIFLSFLFFFPFCDSISVCGCHYAPKWLWPCNCLLDCGGGGLATNKIYILVILKIIDTGWWMGREGGTCQSIHR